MTKEPPPRQCGSCHACCVHTPVTEMNKPAGVRCPKLKNGPGCCSIYATRPDACGVYTCAWLEGYFPKSMRPDKSGILLERGWIEHPRPLETLIGYETRPGALDLAARRIEQHLPAGVVVMVIPNNQTDGPSILGQETDVEAFVEFMANCQERGGITHVMNDKTVDIAFDEPIDGQLVQIQGIKP